MSGGSALTSRVSAALRSAGLPILRYQDRIAAQGHSGIKVSNGPNRGGTWVSVVAWADETSFDRDHDTEKEWTDQALAVLLARGFNAQRSGDHSINVDPPAADSSPGQTEDVRAGVESNGLDISQPAPNEWHVEIDGRRGAYVIRRTGKDARTRFAVHGRGTSAPLARNLRTMADAIDAVKRDIEGKSS